MNEKEIQRRKLILEYDKQFNFENWFELIKEFTIKSIIFDTDFNEIKLLLKLINNKNIYNNKEDLEEDEKEILNNFKNKIEKNVKEFESNGYFIRLGPRSPKDGNYFIFLC
jgi:hypothetical protein